MLKFSYLSEQYLDTEHAITYAFGKMNAVIIADIDGNGYTDLVTFPSNFTVDTPLEPVVWSNEKGIFTPKNSLISQAKPYQYFRDSIPGDFNGDGYDDYLQVDQGWELNERNPDYFFGNHPALLTGKKGGLLYLDKLDWLEKRAATTKTFNHIGAAADYDGDGDLDVAIAAFFDYRLYKNDGVGNFSWQETAIPNSSRNASGTTFIKLGDQYAIVNGFYRMNSSADHDSNKPLMVLTQNQGIFSEAYTLARPDLGGRERNYGAADMYNIDINADGRQDLVVTWETEPIGGIDDGQSVMTGASQTQRYRDLSNTLVNVYLQNDQGKLVVDPAGKIYNLYKWVSGAQLHFLDFNNDGYLDFYSTTYGTKINEFDDLIWINDKGGGFRKSQQKQFDTTEVLQEWYRPSAFFFDANNDGSIDVVAMRPVFGADNSQRNIGEEIRVFLNAEVGESVRNFNGSRKDFSIISHIDRVVKISGPAGNQSFAEVKRLKFSDASVALDLDGNAGQVAKLLGAVFGKGALTNKEYVGIGLGFIDGGMSYQDLAALAVSVAGKSSSTDVCTLLWTNVMGNAPTTADIAPFKAMLDSGQMSIGSLTTLAADTSFNTANIGLVGLSQTGLEFV